MSHAVMQTGPEPPSIEQLGKAFQSVPELTAVDAGILGKDAFGVLAKGLDLEQATAMKSGLAAQGVEAEVVEERVLTELPPPRQLTKVEFEPDSLLIDNSLGQSFRLDWKDVSIIAAGRVRLTEFNENLVEKVVVRPRTWGRGADFAPKVVLESQTTEEQKDHLLLEIITRGAAVRCNVVADKLETHLLFQCLGERRGQDAAVNLTLLVKDLAKFAPAALLNHGAFYMREDGSPSFSYPSQTAFYREITWLLWLASTGRTQR